MDWPHPLPSFLAQSMELHHSPSSRHRSPLLGRRKEERAAVKDYGRHEDEETPLVRGSSEMIFPLNSLPPILALGHFLAAEDRTFSCSVGPRGAMSPGGVNYFSFFWWLQFHIQLCRFLRLFLWSNLLM